MRRLFILTIVLGAFVCIGCGKTLPPAPSETLTEQYAVRGYALVNGLAACGYCHSVDGKPDSPLAGGREFTDRYGPVIAANLTPYHLGGWSNEEIVRVFRSAQGKDGRDLSTEVHRGYEFMSDEDLLAAIAYLRSLFPVQKDNPERDLGVLQRNFTGFTETRRTYKGYVPSIERRFDGAYGTYLTDHVARCTACHNSPSTFFEDERYLMGGKVITADGEQKVAPSLRPEHDGGIGSWSEDALVRYLQTGNAPLGEARDKRFCPVEFYARASTEDLHSLARAILGR